MLQSHDTVLSQWDRGLTSREIAASVNLRDSYVRMIVQRARAKGDRRAHKRQGNRKYPLGVMLPREIIAALSFEADRRDISERELAIRIIETALNSNIVGAILDDGEGE